MRNSSSENQDYNALFVASWHTKKTEIIDKIRPA